MSSWDPSALQEFNDYRLGVSPAIIFMSLRSVTANLKVKGFREALGDGSDFEFHRSSPSSSHSPNIFFLMRVGDEKTSYSFSKKIGTVPNYFNHCFFLKSSEPFWTCCQLMYTFPFCKGSETFWTALNYLSATAKFLHLLILHLEKHCISIVVLTAENNLFISHPELPSIPNID